MRNPAEGPDEGPVPWTPPVKLLPPGLPEKDGAVRAPALGRGPLNALLPWDAKPPPALLPRNVFGDEAWLAIHRFMLCPSMEAADLLSPADENPFAVALAGTTACVAGSTKWLVTTPPQWPPQCPW